MTDVIYFSIACFSERERLYSLLEGRGAPEVNSTVIGPVGRKGLSAVFAEHLLEIMILTGNVAYIV